MEKTNPLKQYFRRPSIYIKLPSQYRYYDENTVERTQTGELAVYPMTSIDEITVRTPDALFNGIAVHDVIKSCVPSIKNPWNIINGDLNAILISIKIASNGNMMELSSTCPSCDHENAFDLDLSNLIAQIKMADFDTPLDLGDLKVKFKPLTYAEVNENNKRQFEIQRMLSVLQTMEDNDQKQDNVTKTLQEFSDHANHIIASTIEYIDTPETRVDDRIFIVEFLANCDKVTNEGIREYSIKLSNAGDLQPLDGKCMECEHEYKQRLNLNVTDFFG